MLAIDDAIIECREENSRRTELNSIHFHTSPQYIHQGPATSRQIILLNTEITSLKKFELEKKFTSMVKKVCCSQCVKMCKHLVDTSHEMLRFFDEHFSSV